MFSRSDSRSTMSISCSCSARQRQLLPEDLDGPRHRRQRIPDLVRDPGGHLADRGEALLHVRVALEPLDIGQILERHQESGASARGSADASRSGRCRSRPVYRPSDSGTRRAWPPPVRDRCRTPRRWAPGAAAPRRSAARATDAKVCPVMISAARLKVRMRCAGSVVASPLGRLSITCWLNAVQVRDPVRGDLEPRAGRSQAFRQRTARAARRRRIRTRSAPPCTGPPPRDGRISRSVCSQGSCSTPGAAKYCSDTRPTYSTALRLGNEERAAPVADHAARQ